MENKNINKNIPIYNFIFTSLKEKNNNIKENILLGNIHFPSSIHYILNKNILNSENHKLFLNNLSNQLNLIKIKEEKEFLNNKIEITNNKIRNLKNNAYYRYDYIYPKNKKIIKKISSESNINILPLISENNNNFKNNKTILLEIKPLIKNNNNIKNKLINKNSESDLEQNAKEFINRINESKKISLSIKKRKQQKDYLKLKKQIEIIEKKRKMREEFEIQRKEEQNKEIIKKQNNNISNIKFPNKKYHYYNKNKEKVLLKNLTDELSDFKSPFYYNNNNHILNQFNHIINSNIYNLNTLNEKRINTESNISKDNKLRNIQPIIIKDRLRPNSRSIINTSNKKHLYYFNVIK